MMDWLKRLALALLDRLLRHDVEETETASTLEAERDAAGAAPSSREETASRLGEDRF